MMFSAQWYGQQAVKAAELAGVLRFLYGDDDPAAISLEEKAEKLLSDARARQRLELAEKGGAK